MYFPKIKRTREQLEFMIQSVILEYGEQEEEQMAVLLSQNYKVSFEDVLDSLRAYDAMPSEDFEFESNKIEYAVV